MNQILVYHIGSLGDTLAIVPALKVLRENFPESKVFMLCNEPITGSGATPEKVLEGSGLVDSFMFYPLNPSYPSLWRLFLALRKESFDSVCYLIREFKGRLLRDRLFFKLCGITKIIGDVQVEERNLKQPDILLKRVSASGLVCAGGYDTSLPGKKCEHEFFLNAEGKRIVGFGIGGKNRASLWPIDRYESLGNLLIKEENIYPVIFGGGAEFDCAQKLIESWGVGENFCGRATVQQTVSVMHQIDIFIGNDTGTIHMAASAGISCVGVYSSRNKPILWNPYGEGHTIIRKHDQFECAECEMETCPYDNACINAITVDEVFNNARQCLKMMEIR